MLAKKVKSTVRGFLHPSSCEQDLSLLPHVHGDLAWTGWSFRWELMWEGVCPPC